MDDGVVGPQAGGRAFEEDLAAGEDIAVVGDFQRLAGVLLDQEDGDPFGLERSDGTT